MLSNRNFWIAQMIGLSALYAAALTLAFTGQETHRLIKVMLVIVGLHLLEVPLAFRMLRGRGAQPLRVFVLTLLFGLLWWVPARRGLFALN